MWKWFVYILKCEGGFYYVGRTWQPDQRWEQHISGMGGKFTKRHPPLGLVYLEEFESFEEASLREKQLKGWTRKKKEKLISGEWGK